MFTSVGLLAMAGGLGPAAAQPAGTLLVGLVAEPVNLDPPQVTDLNSLRVARRIVETLVTFPEESTQIVPGLAESWTISKDGLTYTFKLRKGVKFHDGTPFNAEAVKFSIERQFNPEHPANKLGKYPFANFFFGNVKAVEAMDDSTVRFVLKEPRASFLAVLTSGAASIVSPTAVRKWGADYPLNPVGTGPFRYVSWQRGQQVVLEKNPDYWKGAVKLDRVVYRPIVEDQARLTELMTGAVDLIVGVPPDFVGQLEGSPKVSIAKQVGAHVWYLGINNQKKPFDDKRVRQALNYAVNKDAIVKDVLKGTGAVSKGPVLPNTWGADAALKAYPYDPQKAKQLLAEAGYPNGFDAGDYTCDVSYASVAEAIGNYLAAVGIRTKVRPLERVAFLGQWKDKKIRSIMQAGAGGHGNADTRIQNYLVRDGLYAWGGYPDIDDLFVQQGRELDPKRRQVILHQIQRLAHERVMHAPLWELGFLNAIGPRVEESGLGLIALHPYSAPYEDLKLRK
jgi:peptide/nickel transport system substrate-binding protein